MSTSSELIPCPLVSQEDPSFSSFTHHFATADGVRLHFFRGGLPNSATVPTPTLSPTPAPPVCVLIAGFPQTSYAWHSVLPHLSQAFHLIALDLPGQGDSDRPSSGYDTQSLSEKVHGLLHQLQLTRYFLVGHDVGAWVAFTYVAMYSAEVSGVALLDAGIPGVTMPTSVPTDPAVAWKVWHFPFHCIPDLPEQLIGGREREYLTWFLRRKCAAPSSITDTALDEYLRCFTAPGGLRAGLAYYRAAPLSAEQNKALLSKGKITTPLLTVSADQGSIPDMAPPLIPFFDRVKGVRLSNCGHFIPEEQPKALAEQLLQFFNP